MSQIDAYAVFSSVPQIVPSFSLPEEEFRGAQVLHIASMHLTRRNLACI